jgi:hypothetical protein
LAQLESILQKRPAEKALPAGSKKQNPSKLGKKITDKLLDKQAGALNKFFK